MLVTQLAAATVIRADLAIMPRPSPRRLTHHLAPDIAIGGIRPNGLRLSNLVPAKMA
jgi:hypothetical protein